MAEVSGPGKLSKRTDLGVLKQSTKPVKTTQPARSYTGGSYGNNKAMLEQQQGASMFAQSQPAMMNVTPLGAPTEFPDQPDSYGASWDANTPGIDTSMVKSVAPMSQINFIYRMMQNDTSGKYEAIYNKLNLG